MLISILSSNVLADCDVSYTGLHQTPEGLDELVVMVGGTIPTEDIPELRRLGISGVFTPGRSTARPDRCASRDEIPRMNSSALSAPGAWRWTAMACSLVECAPGVDEGVMQNFHHR